MCDEISESSMMDEENKVNIEETAITWIKSEAHEEVSDFEEKDVKQYKITVEYDNIHGETSDKIKFKEDSDNLISSLDNDEMENTIVKLENVKQEEEGSFNIFLCSKCNGNYRGYCLKCSTLLCVLNSAPIANIKSELNAIPIDILEIRETYTGKGVFLLKTLPKNVILGPFEGISGIESTVGHSWRICDNKLLNIENSNWMKDVFCAANILFKNLDIYQIDGNLYFQTSREIIEGEELLIYYNEEEIQKSDDTKECLYTPPKHEKLPEIFACTLCCLGFGTDECLMEHKMKCPRREQTRNMEDFELVECHYCKMWLEKQEHEEYHTAYCSEKHDRMGYNYSKTVDGNEMSVEEMENQLITKKHRMKSKYAKELTKRDQRSSRADHEHTKSSIEKKYECFECTFQTNYKGNLKTHLNTHSNTKLFQCGICMKKFNTKQWLKIHMKNKHTEIGNAKDFKCAECSFETNIRSSLKRHLNTHEDIKYFQCDICMIKFRQKIQVQIHIKNKHPENGDEKDYKCPDCSFQTNYKGNLNIHLKSHKDLKPFNCSICSKKFTQECSLKVHIKNKHINYSRKLYECPLCVKKFVLKYSLKMHMKDQHSEEGSAKDYKCPKCSYETNHKRSIEWHLNTHNDIRPYHCDFCSLKFAQKRGLTIHIKNKHTQVDVKDYKCSECSYQTNFVHYLNRHMITHSGIKAFECGICDKKFSEKKNRNRHVKNQHAESGSAKKYKCPECSYQTNYKHNLQVHLKQHDIKPLQSMN